MFPLKMGLKSVPPLHLRGFFGPCSLDMGLFQSFSKVYVPNITLEIDGLIGINVNFGHLLPAHCLLTSKSFWKKL